MGAPPLIPTHGMARNQNRARAGANALMQSENRDGLSLSVQDMGRDAGYVIYIYNIMDREWECDQPPKWPQFMIPACPPDEPFVYKTMAAFSRESFWKTSDPNEISYKMMDARKDATTLLNPEAYPGTDWRAQIQDWSTEETAITGGNTNRNKWGCFWSLTEPDLKAPSKHLPGKTLADEIKLFKDYVTRTMNSLVKTAEILAAQRNLADITPNMHFAMDYLGKQAPWHMSLEHIIRCPNCGDPVKEGIAYHVNAMKDYCIIDFERCEKLGIVKKQREAAMQQEEELPPTPPAPRKRSSGGRSS